MAGEARQYALRGIIPRALQHIFQEVDARVDKQICVRMSYLEIYNEVRFLCGTLFLSHFSVVSYQPLLCDRGDLGVKKPGGPMTACMPPRDESRGDLPSRSWVALQ